MPILEAILPILLIATVGYLAVYLNFISKADSQTLSKLVFNLLLPALLFVNTAKASIPPQVGLNFLLAYYIPAILVFIIAASICAKFFRKSRSEHSTFALGSTYSNATIIAIPVCLYGLGEAALVPLFVIVSIHNIVLFSLGILLAESNQLTFRSSFALIPKTLKSLVRTPITVSLILGGLFNLLDIPLLSSLEKPIVLLGNAGVPLALFVLGANLRQYTIRGSLLQVSVIISLKMILLPFLVWIFAFHLFHLDPLWATVAVLTAAMPIGVITYVFSQKYQALERVLCSAILISTLISVITLTILLTWLTPI